MNSYQRAEHLTGYAEAAIENQKPDLLTKKLAQAFDQVAQEATVEAAGRIHALANNYALAGKKPPQDITAEHYQKAIEEVSKVIEL